MPAEVGAARDPESRLQHALELSFRQLGRRDRTEAELRGHLEGRGVDAATIDAALASLREQGYVDDARYAQRFAEDKRRLEQWGSERIERRLRECGVPGEHVEAALAGHGREEQLGDALALLRRRFPVLEDPRDARRALGVLVRKGFEPELAGDAVAAHRRAE